MIDAVKRGRVAAVFAAVCALLVATVTPAHAAPVIDPSRTANLHIVKLADDPAHAGTPATGAQTGVSGEGIEDVGFTVERIASIDLTSQAGWEAAAAMTVAEAVAAAKDHSVSGVTGPNGHLSFTDLPLGLYLVTETSTPPGVVKLEAPFLVTLPMTDPDNLDAWMYDVYVYPKNAEVVLEKTVIDDDAAVAGDAVTFEFSMNVPDRATKVVLTDQIDGRLDFAPSDGTFWFTGDALGVQPLSANLGEVTYEGGLLTVTFTDADLLASNATLGFRFTATVTASGEIVNDGTAFITTPGGTTEVDSNDVVTKWGDLEVLKTDRDGAPLAGAQFCLAATEAAARAKECLTDVATSDAHGALKFTNLRYSEFANNTLDFEDQTYWLVELVAPAGYELQAEPIEVRVRNQADGSPDVTVVNVPHNAGFELPAIGGNRAVLPILMAAAAAAGVLWMVRSRRQDAKALRSAQR